MEKRAILAAVLMLAVFIGYIWVEQRLSPPPPPPRTASAPEPAPAPAPAPTAPAPAPAPAPPPVAAAPRRAPSTPLPPQRLATVETPLYRAVVSSEGGKLQELVLSYRGSKPLVIVGEVGPRGLVIAGDPVPMRLSTEHLVLDAAHPEGELVLTGEPDGLRVRETLRFRADDYTINTRVRIENLASTPKAVPVALPWDTRQSWKDVKETFLGQHPAEIVWESGRSEPHREPLCGTHETPSSDTDWIGVDSTGYLAALVPRTGGFHVTAQTEDKRVCDAPVKTPVGRATIAAQATPQIAPGQAWEGEVLVFAGPKEYRLLRPLGLAETINFGGFPIPRRYGGLPMEWLGVPLLLLLNWVQRYVGNYGIAIILITIVSKVLFYPLTVKSMRSMKAMQALQPQVNALRAKYKNDPQALQREQMELWRKHGVNPMGGCLPMIAQIPIFYALYLALSVSVELQNASFLCFGRIFGVDVWICDLAAHDPTYILPILMGISMFVQQKMTPTAADPRQAKMMLFMPAVFTFMFLNLPSGLVLYWTVSNVLQIAQQWYMDRPKARAAAREAKHGSRA